MPGKLLKYARLKFGSRATRVLVSKGFYVSILLMHVTFRWNADRPLRNSGIGSTPLPGIHWVVWSEEQYIPVSWRPLV